jgi:hypothetical protein
MPATRRSCLNRWGSLLGALALAVGPAGAQEPAPNPAPRTLPPPPCRGEEHRQFDFWVGEWDVTRADGRRAGTNRIESILDGCVLHESWRSADGRSVGQSFNILARDGRWHQTWVDNSGLLLELVGGMVEDRMVLGQDTVRPDRTRVRHEISWERLPTGQVKQHWRTSQDGGSTWTDVFVGIYTRKS